MSRLYLNPIGYLYHFNQDIFLSVYDGISIGRERGNIMITSDALLSELHCDFEVGEKSVIIRDLDSDSGVKVNGKFVTEQKLRFEDAIEVGNQKFRFVKKKRKMDENQFIRSYNPFVLPFLPHKWSPLFWSWSLVLIVVAFVALGMGDITEDNLPHNPLAVLSFYYSILLGIYYIFGSALNIFEWKLINPGISRSNVRVVFKAILFILIVTGTGPTTFFISKYSGHLLMNVQNDIVAACRNESGITCLREIRRNGKDLEIPWLLVSNADGLDKIKKKINKKSPNKQSRARKDLKRFIKKSRASKNKDEIIVLSKAILERIEHLRYVKRRATKLAKEVKAFKGLRKK